MELEEKPRLSRLTAILTQLQSKSLITAKQLAERHQVSIRTIYRDIRTLEKSGIPIVTEEGKGYSLMEGYHLPPVLFSEDEANALITIEQLALKNKDQSFVDNISTGIEKNKGHSALLSKRECRLTSRQNLFLQGTIRSKKTSNNLMQIQSAITKYEVLQIVYLSAANKRSTRNIEPFAIYSIHW